jgi:hypothetical protein
MQSCSPFYPRNKCFEDGSVIGRTSASCAEQTPLTGGGTGKHSPDGGRNRKASGRRVQVGGGGAPPDRTARRRAKEGYERVSDVTEQVTAQSLLELAESIQTNLQHVLDAESRALEQVRELLELLEKHGDRAFDRYTTEMTYMSSSYLSACLDPEAGDEATPALNRREAQDLIDLMRLASRAPARH